MPVSNDETKLNVRIVEISRFCSSLLERSGQTVSGDESQASSGRDLDSNVCSTSEMLNSWRPFDAAREGDDASSTSDISSVKDRSLEARIRASSAREEYEQLKLLIHEQRKKYKSRVLAERAKRKAIERLFAQKNASSPSESEGATSDFTLAQSSQETDWSDQFLSDLVRKTAHRRVPARQFKNKSTQALSGYCSCSNGSYRSAASRRPQPNAASESPSAPSSSSAEEDALRTRRPHVVRSIENRRERLRKSRSYRGMLSAKIRQQAEHVALGLISEQEARNAILSLPRPDVFLNVDLVRETRRSIFFLAYPILTLREQEARNAILSLPRPDVFLNVDLVRETRRLLPSLQYQEVSVYTYTPKESVLPGSLWSLFIFATGEGVTVYLLASSDWRRLKCPCHCSLRTYNAAYVIML
ncbi:hypothetical protein M513_09179 [Trichuris suis]|uniref:Uncharacterized protein n=1 Tax=Trichuris suis TaxID=68888 RepID=A0A085LYB9_9BILA|nr:hypothetical protein M513_09179 [Trichuris suis]